MNNQNSLRMSSSCRLMTLILSEDQSGKFADIAREKKIRGGIALRGKGTISSQILNMLGLKSQKKIIINIILEKERTTEILNYVAEELGMQEPNQGIAFTTSASVPEYKDSNQQETHRSVQYAEEESMFTKLTVIVDRGMAGDVMDVAREAGVTGGTILHGRGTGSAGVAKLFGMEIEPEKELIIMIMPNDLLEKVVDNLLQKLKLDAPGNGILFSEPVCDVRGLYEGDKKQSD